MSIPVPNRSAGQSASLISLASRTALLRLVKPTSPPPRQNDDDTHRDRRPPDPKPDPVKPIPASSQALCDFAAGRLASARSCIVESLPEDERFRPELVGGRIGLLLMGAIAAHTEGERRRDGQVGGGAGQPPAPPSPRATVAELVGQLSARDHGLARVLLRCSYLCDGIAIRGPSIVLNVGPTVDVSPPFAGR